MSKNPEDIVRKHIDDLNRHDMDAVDALHASNVVLVSPLFPEPVSGKEALRKSAEALIKAFPDLQFKISNIVAKGDSVVVERVITGTHSGPLVGPRGTVPPTNRRVDLREAIFFRVNAEGLISEERMYLDAASFMQQLAIKAGP